MFGDHVPQHDPPAAGAESTRRLGERIAHHLEHGSPHHPREGRQDHDPDRDHRVPAVRAEEAGDHDREDDPGQREHHVDDPHQHRVDDPFVVARQHPEQEPADEGDRDRDCADIERDLRPVDDARERVAADLVGAHRVGPARIREPIRDELVRVGLPDEPAEHGDEDVEDDDARADQADRIAPLAEERPGAGPASPPGGRDLGGRALGRERRRRHGSSSGAHSWVILGSMIP